MWRIRREDEAGAGGSRKERQQEKRRKEREQIRMEREGAGNKEGIGDEEVQVRRRSTREDGTGAKRWQERKGEKPGRKVGNS